MDKSHEVLIREKIRYNLKPEISSKEKKLLKRSCPVQKIIKHQIMQDVYLDLSYNVLIPRYETEEVILECYKHIDKNSNVLDLGCGSGFIGLAIKKNINCNVILIDNSIQAIKQTKKNAKLNQLQVNVIKSNWFSKIKKQQFDLIVSNPPYLAKSNAIYSPSLKWEPKKALFAKNNGFKHYETILHNAKNYLKSTGKLIFEIDPYIGQKILKLYPNITLKEDINKKIRIAILTYNDLK
ncbi:peptide chain release factor N(5)-glutamine methyltransferase [Metamycoplasma hyosynoviae]|uniref:peptide chain release factor N(5)-glutamine methyltransferase n=3 Tax=Metamycoplasma hyosynoviae TaxID=29559 RepID=UPI002358CCDB|nr:peptide chain release factor N(5)-glutamine methyltransferase [Metamycoplasma hyosynoviae]MDC8901164.1 peptide chain release factor N(5)-glutamine methyltransferase [Metamycoplasma hyosynoviae]MDC8912061.1 peptide chain release factor N(5)-glutamine methyltransferase [Metamycoplasma hyosynoviae]MDC8912686.1 peptide chain release factor N(5)-glutamine methyltransferase [Metamycoplasma hyosynoviae]MDC8912988.1 peptide chain release factor N(5)-glutamine methyltransferase [Metamycoplasma hyosyn